MSERTDALGRDASGLTRADLDERRVLVPASAASRIATELDRIDFAFGALQDVDLDVDAARTLGFTPSHGSALWSASGRPAPHIRFSTTALRRDWETLCEDPMWSQLFPPTPGSGCDPLHRLRQIQPFLDDLDIRPRFGEATFSWERPQTLIPGCVGGFCFEGRGPVLVMRVPFSVDPDPVDFWGALFDIRASRW